jgi:ABC-type phosphate transport system permease subunit
LEVVSGHSGSEHDPNQYIKEDDKNKKNWMICIFFFFSLFYISSVCLSLSFILKKSWNFFFWKKNKAKERKKEKNRTTKIWFKKKWIRKKRGIKEDGARKEG